MKKMLVVAVLLAVASVAQADLLVAWDFSQISGIFAGSVEPQFAADPMVPTNSMLANRGAGITPASNTGGYAANQWASTTFDNTDYFQFDAVADSGIQFATTGFVFNLRRSTSGPTNFLLRSSVDDFTSDLATWTITANGTYSTPLSLANNTGVTFRLYAYGSTSAAGSANLGGAGNDIALYGTAIPEPATLLLLSIGTAGLVILRRRRVGG